MNSNLFEFYIIHIICYSISNETTFFRSDHISNYMIITKEVSSQTKYKKKLENTVVFSLLKFLNRFLVNIKVHRKIVKSRIFSFKVLVCQMDYSPSYFHSHLILVTFSLQIYYIKIISKIFLKK